MEIFEINGNLVRPTAQILTVKPFQEIWNRDKSKGKSIALQEFAYVEFMISKKKTNPYKGYSDELKEEKIITGVIKEDDWSPDDVIQEAMEIINDWQLKASPTVRYYNANLEALNKTIDYLENTLDYDEKTNAGMPVYKFTDIVRGIKEADQVLKSLTSLRTKVEEELFEASKTKANKDINPYER